MKRKQHTQTHKVTDNTDYHTSWLPLRTILSSTCLCVNAKLCKLV